MTRYIMVADLRRCVGCQTCTAACKQANGTPPGVQWRRVMDIEVGSYPEVQRVFLPTGCQHCADPPCVEACPSTATSQRADGLVTIDYDICIGCLYCGLACPYEARQKIDAPIYAYGPTPNAAERVRFDAGRIGVAQKCTFCIDVIDRGKAAGLIPGRDAAASPSCANACISRALTFGDRDDPDSAVSQLLRDNKYFQVNAEAGTNPGFYYLWDKETPPL